MQSQLTLPSQIIEDNKDKCKKKEDNIVHRGLFVIKEIIKYLVEWHEATPKESCWIQMQTLRDALDAVGQYEYKVFQEKYKKRLANTLEAEVVNPMVQTLSHMVVSKPAMKVGGPRFGPKPKKNKYDIKSDDSFEIEILDSDEEDARRPKIARETRIVKCFRNNSERQLYFMVQWKGTLGNNKHGSVDLISAEKFIKRDPALLAEYLLQRYLEGEEE